MANRLQYENSPYLKQHAQNPVEWFPWGQEALTKAKNENKLILISIGYSACHWCHVMERESFENQEIAALMNESYVAIKVDREERPDIDQIYMIAVQLMTNSGGWPLNCICLPDGRPIYGGTYFKPEDWKQVLREISTMWVEKPEVAIDYASRLTQGINQAENLPIQEIPSQYTEADLQQIVHPWIAQFDHKNGGYKRSPKFPLPNNWIFLLRYGYLSNNQDILQHVHFTLDKIAQGGIYDHIGGGFARYSVDEKWHVPHFEKMLYDNAQLLSLYSEAYQHQQKQSYRLVVEETIAWAEREMLSENGGFFSALDADSEGIEGKFYTFGEQEFDQLGADAELAKYYFNITAQGNWSEENTNIPFVGENHQSIIAQAGFTEKQWNNYLKEIKTKLLGYRDNRVKPGLDHKQLTSWNALFLKGLIDSYRVFQTEQYLQLALNIARFIENHCTKEGLLLHQPEDKNRHIPGFLDDYAFTIEGYISLYEATFDDKFLYKAKELAEKVIDLFYDSELNTFYYTSSQTEQLIARKSEIMDNVIPSSSSAMVRQLFKLGLLFDQKDFTQIGEKVFAKVLPHIKSYGSAYSNWAIQLAEFVYPVWEIALTGKEQIKRRIELDRSYIPNKITLGGTKSNLPLLVGKEGLESKSYLCQNKTCSLPLQSIAEVLELINSKQGLKSHN